MMLGHIVRAEVSDVVFGHLLVEALRLDLLDLMGAFKGNVRRGLIMGVTLLVAQELLLIVELIVVLILGGFVTGRMLSLVLSQAFVLTVIVEGCWAADAVLRRESVQLRRGVVVDEGRIGAMCGAVFGGGCTGCAS